MEGGKIFFSYIAAVGYFGRAKHLQLNVSPIYVFSDIYMQKNYFRQKNHSCIDLQQAPHYT